MNRNITGNNNTWTVFANIPKTLWWEFKDAGLVPQIDEIVKNAIEDAILLKKEGGK